MALGRRIVSALVACGLVPGTGCSWIFVNQPPAAPVPVTPPVVCTSSVASPVVDSVLAAAALGAGIATAAMSSKSSGSCTGFGCIDMSGLNTAGIAVGVVLGVAAVPLGFSAAHGYSTTAECRELKATQLACVSGVEASCNRLMKDALERCERSSQEACDSAGDSSRSCSEEKVKSCMEAAGWTAK
jgi:hypothetical protein